MFKNINICVMFVNIRECNTFYDGCNWTGISQAFRYGFAVSETLQNACSWLNEGLAKHAVSMLQAFCTEAESAKPRSNDSETLGKVY